MDELEKAFRTTTEILFGKPLGPLAEYREWLFRFVGEPERVMSEISDKTVYIPSFGFYLHVKQRLVTLEESLELGKRQLSPNDVQELKLSNASQKLEEIKFITPDVIMGRNIDVRETGTYMNARHCLDGVFYFDCKFVAYCFWPRNSEYCFGCHTLLFSKFCIKCYNSEKLVRCFEVSESNGCSDSYFCHNCENLSNCLFCFNAKGLRYAIGNVEVGKEEFLRVRGLVLGDIAARLETSKALDVGIYSLGKPNAPTSPPSLSPH